MLVIIGVVLLVFWILGLAFRVAGGMVHVLLVLAAVLILLHFLRGG